MDFRDITVDRQQFTVDDIEPGMRVYADVGKHITDAREATVKQIDEENGKVVLTLGPGRMDGPYYVPIGNIRRLLDKQR